jgi:DNA-binding transcriptional LysR family regulator
VNLLEQMTTFVSVVDGKSLSAAARARHLSLPAVSRQLRALELELGASLIVRSTRRLHVTDAGRAWYERCKRVLHELEEGRAAARNTRSVSGRLVISAPLTFGASVIVPRLPKLAAQHPHLVIDLRLEDQLIDLVAEGVDVAVRAGSPPPDSTAFVAHALFSMQRILVAAPRWLKRHGTPREPDQLTGHDSLIQVTPAGIVVPWSLGLDGGREGPRVIEVHGRLRSNAPSALRDFALQGAGVAFLPEWLVAEDIDRGRLRRVLPRWSSSPITAWLIHRAELRGAPRIRAFLDAMPETPSQAGAPL